jgi:methylated-DNA-[protein]-cysteine S-methyltransferase
MAYHHKIIASPVGDMMLIAGDKGLEFLIWTRGQEDKIPVEGSTEMPDHPLLLEATKQLEEYFAHRRKDFDLPIHFTGSDFQVKVWEALLTIPFGQTRTYGEIARQIGQPEAVRAVGGAANRNPIAIVAPCHRVIGSDGKLVGFGGGLQNKSILLQLEKADKAPTLF